MALKVSSLFSTSGGYRGPSPHVSLSEQSQSFDTGLVSLSERPQSFGLVSPSDRPLSLDIWPVSISERPPSFDISTLEPWRAATATRGSTLMISRTGAQTWSFGQALRYGPLTLALPSTVGNPTRARRREAQDDHHRARHPPPCDVAVHHRLLRRVLHRELRVLLHGVHGRGLAREGRRVRRPRGRAEPGHEEHRRGAQVLEGPASASYSGCVSLINALGFAGRAAHHAPRRQADERAHQPQRHRQAL